MAHLAFEIEQFELTKADNSSKYASVNYCPSCYNFQAHYVYNCKKLIIADNICKENWVKV